ncbi:hypothetical protein DLAC_05428 [Tieghemostelium lacteum]|uniref:B box-type domain-containing protein n=1 Tax=Tieghemostelium lacteum TaxID=361077 RepID=A0A151ZG53_TIELA|nr:hypothetical protein DLAC_05428 [Tieghemostelium lacteum]|eukprot:KYQ92844.1 hypothetical protein DLAC_05428 [Tieghemostelium lacteum]
MDVLESCTSNRHLRSQQLNFCKDCDQICCAACQLKHTDDDHEVIDLDEYNLELTKYCEKLSQHVIKTKEAEKENLTSIMKKEIHEHSLQLNAEITSQFDKYRKMLAIKEQELKDQISQVNDDNLKIYFEMSSQLEFKIQQSLQIQSEAKLLQKSTASTNGDNSEFNPFGQKRKIEDVNDDEFLRSLESKKKINTTNILLDFIKNANTPNIQPRDPLYKKLKFNPQSLDGIGSYIMSYTTKECFDKSMVNAENGQPVANSQSPLSSSVPPSISGQLTPLTNYVMKYGFQRGLEKINCKTNEVQIKKVLPPKESSFFYQDNNIEGTIYLFDRDRYYFFSEGDKGELSWKCGDFKLNQQGEHAYGQSTCYDQKDHIYLIGGEINPKTSAKNIIRFNIRTKQFEKAGELINRSQCHSLSYHDDSIFIIGGFDGVTNRPNHNPFNTSIYRYDCKTQKIETLVTHLKCKKDGLSSACIDHKNGVVYYLSVEKFGFYKYEIKQKIFTSLNTRREMEFLHYSKLYYDGQNIIYLISGDLKVVLAYNVQQNYWNDPNIRLTEDKDPKSAVNHDYYCSFLKK